MTKNIHILLGRTALYSAIGLSFFGQAAVVAQDNDAVIEEIVVTGKRASLEMSLDSKRNAKTVMDSISSEELGKFPDANVADSLQHITGITISRTHGGEGQYVTVRGLPSEYNIVTLNNRILATDDDGRNFAFDVLPSSVISGADVLKSSQASALEGSIGGSINLRSARPLDTPGQHGAISLEGEHNDLSKKEGFKATGVYSNSFNDDTVGVMLGFTYSDKTVRSDALKGIWYNQDWPSADDLGIDIGDAPYLASTCCTGYGTAIEEKKRWALSGSLQFKPSDDFEMTIDGMFTRLDSPAAGYYEAYYVEYGDWFGPDEDQTNWSNIVVDDGIVTSMTVTDMKPETMTIMEHRVVDTYQVGWNGDWQASDNLRVTGDIYLSKSERKSGGKDSWVVAQGPFAQSVTYTLNPTGLPDIDVVMPDGSAVEDLTNDQFGVHWAELGGTDVEDKVFGSSVDFEYTMGAGALQVVKFGAAYTKRDKMRNTVNNMDHACDYCGSPFTFGDVGASVTMDVPVDNLLTGVDGDFPRTFQIFDLDAYWAAIAASDGMTINGRTFGPNESDGIINPVVNPVNSYDIAETTWSGYVQADFEGDQWFANAGIRLVHTKTEVGYASNDITSIVFVPDPDGGNTAHYDVTYSEAVPHIANGDYTKFLPSANFGYWIQEDLLLRAAAARVVARPSLDQLAPMSEDSAYAGDFSMFFSGNVDLEPIQADQIDLGIEWYYQEGSALTAAVFYKDIDGFITSQASYDVPIAGQLFYVERPMNGQTATVKGIELGVQHFFGNGFGLVANYTYTDTNAKIDGEVVGDLEGVSKHAYSLSAIYEKDRLSVHVSADYSGRYIDELYSPLEGIPSTAEPVTWVTAGISYDVTDNIEVTLKGNNLTNANKRSYLGDKRMVYDYEIWGRSVILGATMRF